MHGQAYSAHLVVLPKRFGGNDHIKGHNKGAQWKESNGKNKNYVPLLTPLLKRAKWHHGSIMCKQIPTNDCDLIIIKLPKAHLLGQGVTTPPPTQPLCWFVGVSKSMEIPCKRFYTSVHSGLGYVSTSVFWSSLILWFNFVLWDTEVWNEKLS